ncbi:single-stranded DNA-binding protein [Phytomonospora sp. NPDC050363]|uniref:single-stranded DNA-binding protein n=1 Tax=Phytomonospora sp. NPDC050363 TaxID=3155642 RepID=UPI0033FCDFB8
MSDTALTVIGNVMTKPSRRRLQPSGVSVTDFLLKSTTRKYRRDTGEWYEGDSLCVQVTCWRELADRVFESVGKGDPVIVHGRFGGKSYMDDGVRKAGYEVEARAVGHDLRWGFATFERADGVWAGAGSGVGSRGGVGVGPPEPDLDRIVLTGMAGASGGSGASRGVGVAGAVVPVPVAGGGPGSGAGYGAGGGAGVGYGAGGETAPQAEAERFDGLAEGVSAG